MSPAVLALLMLVIVVAFILWNKVPLNFIMFVVPVIFSFLMGYNVMETSTFIINQIVCDGIDYKVLIQGILFQD